MRTIDADALKGEKFYSHERHEYCVSVYAIDTMPTIEPDRPHGEWIKKHYSDQMAWATCSVCGSREEQIYNESPNATEDTMVICRYFCPNCGSDNRKEGDEK